MIAANTMIVKCCNTFIISPNQARLMTEPAPIKSDAPMQALAVQK
jgi:hypothetical protein